MASLTSLLRGLTSGMQYYPPRSAAVTGASRRGTYEVTAAGGDGVAETVTAVSAIGDVSPGQTVMLEKTPSGWVISGTTNQAGTTTKRILIDG